MRDRLDPISRLAAIAAACALIIVCVGPARADVFGRLHFSIKNAADEKPIAGAKITLKDSAGVRPNVLLTSDATGGVTSGQLETRSWGVTVEADTYQTDTRQVTVAADTTTEVEVLLEPLKEKVIKIKTGRDIVRASQTSDATRRDQTVIQKIPVTAGNPQSLTKVTMSLPGFAQDSVNQAHPRAEHSSTSINIDGFALPGVLQGRAGPVLNPNVIQSLEVLTGGYAPEYGGELAAVFNAGLRAGPIRSMRQLTLQGGEFATSYAGLSIGGQLGQPIGQPDANGEVARRFGYFLDFTGRQTNNAIEPPQPDDQSAHNHGESETYFGNFSYRLGNRDNVTFAVNAAPGYTQIANRTGLPDTFASVGQGFGYAGHLSRADAMANGILSQQAAGQDVIQKDQNEFGALNWRHGFSDKLTGLFSVGVSHAGIDIKNGNPAVDLNNLPGDSSIEFNPFIMRHAHNLDLQGNLTFSQGKHTFKFGLRDDEQSANDQYNIVPASQLAVNALAAVDTRLLPPGAFADGETDELDNPVYQLAPNGTPPTLFVRHRGFYRAAYAQDTWNISRRLTANYGARLDWYRAEVTLLGETNTIDTMHLSPRFNLSYLVLPKTVGRLIYNRVFTQPPLSQGATLGLAIPPQVGNLYEGNIERQIGSNQSVKFAYYYKDWRDYIDTGLLIPGTQIGVYTTVSHPHVDARGFEFSYDLAPRNNVGLGAFVTYANSVNRLLAPESGYTDHDQLNTIGFGLDWTWADQASLGFSLYHGSGVASSVVFDDRRTPRTVLNLRLASRPDLFGGTPTNGRGGLILEAENFLDDRPVINFQSAFSGTRFQQGRRILLSAFGKF